MKKIHQYKHGLEIIEGLMGSGKTYFAVKRVIKIIRDDRRVVYTNLPVRLRVLRRRLHSLGGPELANLIQPLTEQHWRRFLRRHRSYAQLREEYATLYTEQVPLETLAKIAQATGKPVANLLKSDRLHSNDLRSWFELENGLNVYQGPDANEIPPYAVIVIDEVQNWHSMIGQSKDPDRENLLDYITKSRHSVHWIWVITQDAKNISIEFRRLAGTIWTVWQLGESALVWGLKFKHLKINATQYKKYTHEQYERKERDGQSSSETFNIITSLPWNRRIYRYYESYTNSGTQRQLERSLKKSRKEAGLSEEGTTGAEMKLKTEKRIGLISRLLRVVKTATKYAIIIIVVFSIGYTFNTDKGDENAISISTSQEEKTIWPEWSLAASRPWIGGKAISTGSVLGNGAELVYVAPDGDSLVCALAGDFWLWEFGQVEPQRVAPIEDVRDAVRQTLLAEIRAKQSKQDAPERVPSPLGSSTGKTSNKQYTDAYRSP